MKTEISRESFRNTGLEHRKNLLSRLFLKQRFIIEYAPDPSAAPDADVQVIRTLSELERFRRQLDAAEFARLARYLASEFSVYLCVEDGSVVGVAAAHHPAAGDVWFDSLPTRPGEARICSMFVSPAHRGSGMAARLRRTLLYDMSARGIARVWSVVEAANHLMRKSIASFDPNQQRQMRSNYLIKLFGINVASVTRGKVYLLFGRRRRKL